MNYKVAFGSLFQMCFVAQSVNAFNLIIIDPPWENGSARQKSLYITFPFLCCLISGNNTV